MIPEPVTDPAHDTGRRALSIYDLEETLVTFLAKLFDSYRLDNPTLNLAQATGPEQLGPGVVVAPRIVRDPDEPPVSYDTTERAQTLALKVAPRVVRGRVPRTVTGEISIDKLPDYPSITVQAISGHVGNDETLATVCIFFHAYDEDPDSGGYQDVQNMIEAASIALTSWGQKGIDQAYVIVMPFDWKLNVNDTFPHYIGELEAKFELPSAGPLPDPEMLGTVPGEHIGLQIHERPIVRSDVDILPPR